MNENICTYGGKRDELLVAYLYGEIDADGRAAFDRHLLVCAPCRAELDALGGVRSELVHWAPPEPAGHIGVQVAIPAAHRQGITAAMRDIPAWAQIAAATLFLGAAAGLANVELSYTDGGVSVRTGWRRPAAVESPTASAAEARPTSAPWRDDLTALERELKAALQARPAAVGSTSTTTGDEALLRRVHQMIQEAERRQQSELALRVAEVARDMQSQRQADLVKIDRTLGVLRSQTGMEVMRTQRQVNSLAQQVSQRP